MSEGLNNYDFFVLSDKTDLIILDCFRLTE